MPPYRVILTEADGESRTVAGSLRLNGAHMVYSAINLHTEQRRAMADPNGATIAARSHGAPVMLPADHQA